jgi:GNAT superfamily N-acetyltransferase
MDATIRAYRDDDLAACRDLWRELTQRHRDIYDDQTIGGDDPGMEFDGHIARPHLAAVWVAERAGAVVGLCGLLIDGEQGEVEPVVVTARERSKGVGRRLLACAIDEARARGVRFLSIRPVARNVEALQLFHECGFRTLGHVDMFMYLGEEPRAWKRGLSLHGRWFSY